MTNDGFKLQASIKDSDGDMVNFRADSVPELQALLLEFPVAAYAQAKANVRGSSSLGQIVQPAPVQQVAQQAAPAPAPWPQPQQQAAPVQQGAPAPSHPAAQLHPEGKACEVPGCGKVLEFKKTQSGKAKWQCPEWRWNNGNPNNHGMEWQN
jgi:hypothetical protein